MTFAKLTPEECVELANWAETVLRPWAEVWKELERPEVLAYLDSIGADHLYPKVKEYAESSTIVVGGGNGGSSFKTQPSYKDIDLLARIPSADLEIKEVSQLQAVLSRRITPEFQAQEISRRLDSLKIGVRFEGRIWPVPAYCQHCNQHFYDGRFRGVDGRAVHVSCLES